MLLIKALLVLVLASRVALSAQTTTVQQDSIPDALVRATDRLLFPGRVTDGGVTLQLFRLQGEGVEYSPDGPWVAYDCKHKDSYSLLKQEGRIFLMTLDPSILAQ